MHGHACLCFAEKQKKGYYTPKGCGVGGGGRGDVCVLMEGTAQDGCSGCVSFYQVEEKQGGVCV